MIIRLGGVYISGLEHCRKRKLILREKVLDLRPKSDCAVKMTMYVDWTCINVYRKDVHA